MLINSLLLALVCVFPRGSESDPGVIAPFVPQGKPHAFWWDDQAFHIDKKSYAWTELGCKPEDGAKFKLPLGEYQRKPVLLEATLNSQSHRLRIGSAGRIGDSDIALKVYVTGGYKDSLRCQLDAEGQTPDYINVFRFGDIQPNETVHYDFGGHGSLSGRVKVELTGGRPPSKNKIEGGDDMQTKSVVGGLSHIIYSASAPYRAKDLLFDYIYVETDRERQEMQIASMLWNDKAEGDFQLRVTAQTLTPDFADSKPTGWIRTLPLPKLWNAETISKVDVQDLPPGFYWMQLDYLDAAGKVVHNDRFRFFKPKPKMEWDGTQLGAEDTVPPPWPAPEYLPDGTFRCWNREFKFGGEGLVTSIRNGGREMLKAPVQLIHNGKPLAFEVKLESKHNSYATYRLKAKGAKVEVEVRCEFDGYVRFFASYGKGTKSLVWKLAMDRDLVAAFDDGRGNDTQELLTGGKMLDRDLDVLKCRWWWAGGPRGICGGLNSLRGMYVKDYAHSGHVCADAEAFTVETKLVDTPFELSGTRTATFYLEPTPMKPKNREFATMPRENIVGWTGHLCEFFETKYPGFAVPEKFKRFEDMVKKGKRVFWYNATHAVSPDDPFWSWYGNDWMCDRTAREYAREVPHPEYPQTKKGRWTYACTNSKTYFDAKVWGINWYFHEPAPLAKDLYFDVCNPVLCPNTNAWHGCSYVDDFGRWVSDGNLDSTRELHLRAYRIVKAKNSDGLMYGHLTKARKPCDAFFDYCCMGEYLAWRVRWQDSYYDIFTPEFMQAAFVPRSVDMCVGINSQFRRWRGCWAPDLVKSFDENEPKMHRAIRHFAAYCVLHDLILEPEGWVDGSVNRALARLGGDLRAWRYYDDGESPVSLSHPGPRQLWAYLKGKQKSMLVVLNDTDAAVEQDVSVKGLKAVGTDVGERTSPKYDFSAGAYTLKLGPRECVLLEF